MSKIIELATSMHKAQREAMVNEPNGAKLPEIVAYVDSDFYRDMLAEANKVGHVPTVVYEFANYGKIGGFPVFEVLPRRNHMSGEIERAKPYFVAIVGWREL